MKSIRQKRQIRSKGLVNPQIAPKNLAQPSARRSPPSTRRGVPHPLIEDGEVARLLYFDLPSLSRETSALGQYRSRHRRSIVCVTSIGSRPPEASADTAALDPAFPRLHRDG